MPWSPQGRLRQAPRGSTPAPCNQVPTSPWASEGEPALLHTWASAEKPHLKEKSSATVYFQTDKHSKHQGPHPPLYHPDQPGNGRARASLATGGGACSPDDWEHSVGPGMFLSAWPWITDFQIPPATIWLSWPPIAGNSYYSFSSDPPSPILTPPPGLRAAVNTFVFLPCHTACGILVLQPGLGSQAACGGSAVLTIGQPRKSL